MFQESKLANYVAEMQRQFDVRIQNALSQILADRLLLAVRGSLIALHGDRNVLAQKWVWSSEQVAQLRCQNKQTLVRK